MMGLRSYDSRFRIFGLAQPSNRQFAGTQR
ncbi:hypothetical protein ABH995_005476 [Bradyrhizobium yuanmingense]